MAKFSFDRIQQILAIANIIIAMSKDLKTKKTTTSADVNPNEAFSLSNSVTVNEEFLELDAALTIAFALEDHLSALVSVDRSSEVGPWAPLSPNDPKRFMSID